MPSLMIIASYLMGEGFILFTRSYIFMGGVTPPFDTLKNFTTTYDGIEITLGKEIFVGEKIRAIHNFFPKSRGWIPFLTPLNVHSRILISANFLRTDEIWVLGFLSDTVSFELGLLETIGYFVICLMGEGFIGGVHELFWFLTSFLKKRKRFFASFIYIISGISD